MLTQLAVLALAALSTASPAPAVEKRQQDYVSVGDKYSAGGCTDSSLIFADPIFGTGNVCQPLSRFAGAVPVVSYKTIENSPGCSVKLYTSTDCSGTAYSAPVGGCVQANAPFVSVFVTCV